VKPNVEKKYLRPSLAFAVPLAVFIGLNWVVSGSGVLWVSFFSGLSDVGVYSLSVKTGWILSFVISSIELGLMPYFYSLRREGKEFVISRLATYYLFFLVIMGMTLSVFSKEIVALLAPPAYSGAAKIIPLIVLAWLFRGFYTFPICAIFYKGNTKGLPLINATTALISVGLNFLLIPHFGIIGAAQAFAATYFVWFLLIYFYSMRIARVDYEYLRIFKLFSFSTLIFVLLWLLPEEGMILDVILKFFALLCFPFGLFFLGFFSIDEVNKARSLLSQYVFRKEEIA
jgi:O-antigen/teichoic acid export membrane protein